jgi:hypothetical protein
MRYSFVDTYRFYNPETQGHNLHMHRPSQPGAPLQCTVEEDLAESQRRCARLQAAADEAAHGRERLQVSGGRAHRGVTTLGWGEPWRAC